MGEVYAAYDRRLHRPVAVKTLRPDVADRAGIVRRFEEEGRIAARLSHAHAVAVFDVGEDGGVPYLVMEYLEGTTLAAEVALGPLEPGRAVRLGIQILGALGAAHAAGIVHRDVKPANIILTGEDNAKVTDFGIAKVVGEDLTGTLGGTTGGVLGTATYIAPERLRGEPATARSDLYSLGAVLYEALCGDAPYQADTPAGLVWAVTSGQRVTLGERRPDLPPGVIEVVETALATDPDDRYPDAASMAAALQAAGALPELWPSRADVTPTVPIAGARTTAPATELVEVLPATEMLAPGPEAPTAAPRRWVVPVAAAGAALVVALVLALAAGGDNPAADPAGGSIGGRLRDAIAAVEQPPPPPEPAPVVVEPVDEGSPDPGPDKGKGKKKKD